MDKSKLDKLNKMLELLSDDTVKPSDIEKFLLFTLDIIKKAKDDFSSVSQATLSQVADALELIKKNHLDVLSEVDTKTNAVTESFKASIAEIKQLAEEIKAQKPENGKDADEEKIVAEVLSKIPPQKEYTPDTAEDIANKLETLKEEARLDASAIKNLPQFIEQSPIPNGGGWRNLFQLHDVSVPTPTNGQALVYNSTTKLWEAGTAGSTSPLTTKGDLYTFSTVDARLGVGSNDQVLVADSTTATGLKWAALGSVVIGGFTPGSVIFADSTGTLGEDNTNFFWNNTTKQLTLSSSLTGSQATNGLSITPTWNTTGNPVALSVNITNTASGTSSSLFNFQTNSVSKLSLTPGGLLQFGVTGTGGVQSHSINPVIYMGTNIVGLTSGNGDLMLSGRQGYGIGFQTSASGATVLRLAILNNGTIQAAAGAIFTGDPVFTGTNNSGQTGPAFNNSGSGGGTSVNLYLRTGGVDRASIGGFVNGDFIIRANGSTEAVRITSGLNMGVGTGATVSARIHGISTTEQLRLGYNSTKYLSTTVSSTGSATFALTGTTPTFTFSQNINAPAFITVGGSSSQFVKGDGSLDSSTYLTSSDFISTPNSTSNGITVSLSSQLSSATMSVTASAATSAQAGVVDTNVQDFGGNKHFYGRVLESSGTFSGTSSVTLGDDGNFFAMGSGTLDEINLTGWDNGSEISLYFPAGGTITNNFTPTGGYGPFLILAGANKTVPTGGIVKFILLNGNWMEVAS